MSSMGDQSSVLDTGEMGGVEVKSSQEADSTDSKVKAAGNQLAGMAVGDATASPEVPKPTDDADACVKSKELVTKIIKPKDEFKYVYNMLHKQRGMALVINNLHFDANTGMSDRVGTDQDAASLCRVFKNLDFEVKLFKDLSKRNMLKLMVEAAQVDHRDNDCFACVILSHGEEGEIYGRDGKIPIDDLIAPFKGDKCRSLAGKPKLFFFQACRGSKLDEGTEVTDATPFDEVDSVAHRIPTEADFLLAYSVVSGYFSWRNSARGSWFIQSLCEVLEEHGTSLEIMRVMTRVNHKVAYEFQSNAAKEYMTNKKQIPCIVSMLTKELFFIPKKVK